MLWGTFLHFKEDFSCKLLWSHWNLSYEHLIKWMKQGKKRLNNGTLGFAWTPVCMCEKQKGWRLHKHHTSMAAHWFSVARNRPSSQKAYQRKTKCISLRRKDIENETGESTKPAGISCKAFQISADMQSINIQLVCNVLLLYICLPLPLNHYSVVLLAISSGPLTDRAGVCPHTRAHSHTETLNLN